MNTAPLWLNEVYFGNTAAQYLTAAVNVAGLFVALILMKKLILSRLQAWAARTPTDFDDFVVSLIAQTGTPTYLAVSLYAASVQLVLPEAVSSAMRHFLILVVTIRLIFMGRSIIRYGVTQQYRRARPQDPSADGAIRNITNVVSSVLWALGLIFLLDNFGLDISALVAGLGIGGIAVAMASQAILGDLFSAVSIFIDKPFEVGDFIIIGQTKGTVEYVGLKTTRIRSLTGEQVVLSNSELTKGTIRNFKRMEMRRVDFKFGIVYDTPAEKIRRVPVIIREIFSGMKDVRLDRAHFAGLGDYSLDFETVYYVHSSDFNFHMDRKQEILVEILAAFRKEGIEFAFPTQTVHFTGSEEKSLENPA